MQNPSAPYKPTARPESDDEVKVPKKKSKKKVTETNVQQNVPLSEPKIPVTYTTDAMDLTKHESDVSEVDVITFE